MGFMQLVNFRRATIVVAGVGISALILQLLFKRWNKRRNNVSDVNALENSFNEHQGAPNVSRFRNTRTPSSGDRISVSRRVPVRYGYGNVVDAAHIIETTLSAMEFVNSKTDREKRKIEVLSSVLQRLRSVEKDLNVILGEDSGTDGPSIAVTDIDEYYSNTYAGTLSVLSDDSFMSALDELPANFDDNDALSKDSIKVEKNTLSFYREGMEAVLDGKVCTRKCRYEFCQCDDEFDFKAKVWCLRKAFSENLSDEKKRSWLSGCARQFFAALLRHGKKDPVPFFKAYDNMISFLNDANNLKLMEEELKQRKVSEIGFWDVVLDFVLIDCFEDLAKPPSAVIAVIRNRLLSQSMKESTLSTLIWSMLHAKRARLSIPTGFISHFYDISEVVSPTLTFGFLGTDEHMRELCEYFKEQICAFVVEIFNVNCVRYTSLLELATDVWSVLQMRVDMINTRLNTELLPN
uniref:Mitoguardin n=1 Tax=Syphacia muris TaxID=451379 RepID=A0A0N5ARA1_9BILA